MIIESGFLFYLGIVIVGLVLMSSKIYGIFKKPKKIKSEESTEIRETNFKTAEEALNFLDRFIKEKYNYHLYLSLLPVYLDKKIPEKNLIKTIKEKIYVSVVGSLSQPMKKLITHYFTEKGIEIYIHEKIITYMNETDFRSAEKFGEAFRDLDATKVDRILKD